MQVRRRSPATRRGFTLLEVMLALAISVILMLALYMVLNTQVRHTQAGREIIEQNNLARAVLTRIANDIRTHLAPLDPRVAGEDATQASGSDAGAADTSGTDGSGDTSAATSSGTDSTGGGNTSSGGSGASSGGAAADAGAAVNQTVVFNAGLQGDEGTLSLYTTRVPKELPVMSGGAPARAGELVSDLRKITYWLAGTPSAPLGLARQEVKVATDSEGLSLQPPGDGQEYVIAEQVTNLTFEYFDGSGWVPSWDGSALQSDGMTPVGPPAAVAVTVTIRTGGAGGSGRPGRETTIRHVVFIPTSNGISQADAGLGVLP